MLESSDRQSNVSDEQFVSMAAQILRNAHHPVRASVRARIRDPDEADDVIQSALVLAWEKLAQLRDTQRLEPWFLRICRTVMSRLASARVVTDKEEQILLAEDAPLTDSDAVEDMLTFDRRVWCIIRLPRQQRAVVIARLYRGLSVAETAELLGKRPGTVKATLNHAMKRLRESEQRAQDSLGEFAPNKSARALNMQRNINKEGSK